MLSLFGMCQLSVSDTETKFPCFLKEMHVAFCSRKSSNKLWFEYPLAPVRFLLCCCDKLRRIHKQRRLLYRATKKRPMEVKNSVSACHELGNRKIIFVKVDVLIYEWNIDQKLCTELMVFTVISSIVKNEAPYRGSYPQVSLKMKVHTGVRFFQIHWQVFKS